MLDQFAVMERRRQILRITLVVIIFATMPLYCLGFFLLATAPDRSSRQEIQLTTTQASLTPIGGSGGLIVTATERPTLSLTLNLPPSLMPTPFQYNPPVINPPTATIFVIIPTSTVAPTLTFPPSITPFPTQENTPLPPPTNTHAIPPTSAPTDPPVVFPTDPPPTDIIDSGVLQPPTDTPTPTP